MAAVDPEGRYGEGDVDDALAAREADLALYREAQARSRPVSRPVSRTGPDRTGPDRTGPFPGPGRAGSRFSVRVPGRNGPALKSRTSAGILICLYMYIYINYI